jgi:hypothetical protein
LKLCLALWTKTFGFKGHIEDSGMKLHANSKQNLFYQYFLKCKFLLWQGFAFMCCGIRIAATI